MRIQSFGFPLISTSLLMRRQEEMSQETSTILTVSNIPTLEFRIPKSALREEALKQALHNGKGRLTPSLLLEILV